MDFVVLLNKTWSLLSIDGAMLEGTREYFQGTPDGINILGGKRKMLIV